MQKWTPRPAPFLPRDFGYRYYTALEAYFVRRRTGRGTSREFPAELATRFTTPRGHGGFGGRRSGTIIATPPATSVAATGPRRTTTAATEPTTSTPRTAATTEPATTGHASQRFLPAGTYVPIIIITIIARMRVSMLGGTRRVSCQGAGSKRGWLLSSITPENPVYACLHNTTRRENRSINRSEMPPPPPLTHTHTFVCVFESVLSVAESRTHFCIVWERVFGPLN